MRSTGNVAVYLPRPGKMHSSNSALSEMIYFFLCGEIVELPGITYKHALVHVGLKRAVLVLLNEEDMCQASPNAKMRDIWLAFEPGLMESHALESGCRKAIPDMNLSSEGNNSAPSDDGGGLYEKSPLCLQANWY